MCDLGHQLKGVVIVMVHSPVLVVVVMESCHLLICFDVVVHQIHRSCQRQSQQVQSALSCRMLSDGICCGSWIQCSVGVLSCTDAYTV